MFKIYVKKFLGYLKIEVEITQKLKEVVIIGYYNGYNLKKQTDNFLKRQEIVIFKNPWINLKIRNCSIITKKVPILLFLIIIIDVVNFL